MLCAISELLSSIIHYNCTTLSTPEETEDIIFHIQCFMWYYFIYRQDHSNVTWINILLGYVSYEKLVTVKMYCKNCLIFDKNVYFADQVVSANIISTKLRGTFKLKLLLIYPSAEKVYWGEVY